MTRALVFAAFVLTALPAVAQLQVQYGAKSLTVSGASARADVVVIGIIHANSKGFESIQTPQSIERTDSAGTVTLAVPRPSFRMESDHTAHLQVMGSGTSTFAGVTVTGTITGSSINATFQHVAEWVPADESLSTGNDEAPEHSPGLSQRDHNA